MGLILLADEVDQEAMDLAQAIGLNVDEFLQMDPNTVQFGTQYIAEDDGETCDACRDNANGGEDGDGVYWEEDPPQPGDDCEGRGNCRCHLEAVTRDGGDAGTVDQPPPDEPPPVLPFGIPDEPMAIDEKLGFDTLTTDKELDLWARDAYSGWADELTAEERVAIDDGWVGPKSGYTDIQAKLRFGDEYTSRLTEVQSWVDGLDSAIAKSSAPDDMVAWRGGRAILSDDPLREELRVGDVFVDKGFVATSLSEEYARSFVQGDQLFRIRILEGSSAAYLDSAVVSSHEMQVLLPRDAEFRVTKITEPPTLEEQRASGFVNEPLRVIDVDYLEPARATEATLARDQPTVSAWEAQMQKEIAEKGAARAAAIGEPTGVAIDFGAKAWTDYLKLNDQEASSVNQYNMFGSSINRALREGRLDDAVKGLDSAISRAYVADDTTVYRGIRGMPDDLGLKPGDVWTDKGYVSTSISKDVAKGFGSFQIEIQVPAGTNGIFIGNAIEKELILPRGTHFEVVRENADSVVLRVVSKEEVVEKEVAQAGFSPVLAPDYDKFPLQQVYWKESTASSPADLMGKDLAKWEKAAPPAVEKFGGAHESLPQDQYQAVDGYKGTAYRGINEFLREGRDPLAVSDNMTVARIGRQIQGLDNLIDRGLTPTDAAMFRGFNAAFKLPEEWTPGAIIQDKGFVSTSLSMDRAVSSFRSTEGDRVLARIEVPAGTPYAWFDTEEMEVLLKRETQFEIQSVKYVIEDRDGMITAQYDTKEELLKATGVKTWNETNSVGASTLVNLRVVDVVPGDIDQHYVDHLKIANLPTNTAVEQSYKRGAIRSHLEDAHGETSVDTGSAELLHNDLHQQENRNWTIKDRPGPPAPVEVRVVEPVDVKPTIERVKTPEEKVIVVMNQATSIAERIVGGDSVATTTVVIPQTKMQGKHGMFDLSSKTIYIRSDLSNTLRDMFDPRITSGWSSTAWEKAKGALKTILHENIHALGEDVGPRGVGNFQRTYIKTRARMFEEGLTELAAREHLDEYIQSLGLPAAIERQLIKADIAPDFKSYPREVALSKELLDTIKQAGGEETLDSLVNMSTLEREAVLDKYGIDVSILGDRRW